MWLAVRYELIKMAGDTVPFVKIKIILKCHLYRLKKCCLNLSSCQECRNGSVLVWRYMLRLGKIGPPTSHSASILDA
jgi:hypothetical protein